MHAAEWFEKWFSSLTIGDLVSVCAGGREIFHPRAQQTLKGWEITRRSVRATKNAVGVLVAKNVPVSSKNVFRDDTDVEVFRSIVLVVGVTEWGLCAVDPIYMGRV